MSYNDYLKSEHWQNKRKETFRYGGKECYVCKSKENLQVHHKTYKRKGFENVATDLFALCGKHHLDVHIHAKSHDGNIWNATVKIKKDFVTKNGYQWGKREIREYFKHANNDKLGSIKKFFY